MIKELPDDWITFDLPRSWEHNESEWSQWLLFNNVTYVISFGKIAIKDPDTALMFRLTFGI